VTSRIGTAERPLRVAIIGAGPSGFYTAGALLDQERYDVSIDMFDRLPTPFGLVRDGVAPDHQKIKAVTRIYEKLATDPRLRFFGNIDFGIHLTREDMWRYYDQVVYAVGTSASRRLDIPGEDFERSYAATDFVGWYNSHPDFADLDFDLTVEDVAIIGNGNVAIDVARILARPVEHLATTDIADHALQRLRESRIKRIHVLGRRGPAQAAFTNPELRELADIEEVDVIVDPADLELDPYSLTILEVEREARRNVETLQYYAARAPRAAPRQIIMRFLVSPLEILGENGHVSAIKLQHNELFRTEDGYLKAQGLNAFEILPVGAVFRAIGYLGVRLPGVPYIPWSGIVPNRGGRVVDNDPEEVLPGEYVVGWAKRGAVGVIGTNKADAVETVTAMLEDVESLEPVVDANADPRAVEQLLRARQPQVVTYDDWLLIDRIETERGLAEGRPRVKFSRISDMLEAIEEARNQQHAKAASESMLVADVDRA
jgi:ferredoxin/flavodoxin---NADP+ reductase